MKPSTFFLIGLWMLGIYSGLFWSPIVTWLIIGLQLIVILVNFWFRTNDK